MEVLLNIAISLLMGSLTAYFAAKRKRSPAIWFFVGLLLGLIGILILFIMPPGEVDENAQKTRENPVPRVIAYTPPIAQQPDPSEQEEWYYLNEKHEQFGPVPMSQLQSLFRSSAVHVTTLVWKEGMNDWKKIDDLPILKTFLLTKDALV